MCKRHYGKGENAFKLYSKYTDENFLIRILLIFIKYWYLSNRWKIYKCMHMQCPMIQHFVIQTRKKITTYNVYPFEWIQTQIIILFSCDTSSNLCKFLYSKIIYEQKISTINDISEQIVRKWIYNICAHAPTNIRAGKMINSMGKMDYSFEKSRKPTLNKRFTERNRIFFPFFVSIKTTPKGNQMSI